MATLALCLALQETRVSLELKNVSLATCMRRALEPFGHIPVVHPADLSKRVSLSLKNAGYLEALDAVSELAGWGPVLSLHHPALDGRGISRGSGGEDRQWLVVTDLSSSLRLIVTREYFTRQEHHLELFLISPPDTPGTLAVFEGKVNETPFRVESTGGSRGWGQPVLFTLVGKTPFLKRGKRLMIEGAVTLGDGGRIPVLAGPIALPPHEAFPDPVPTRRELWVFLAGGLALSATLILGGVAVLSRSLTSRRA